MSLSKLRFVNNIVYGLTRGSIFRFCTLNKMRLPDAANYRSEFTLPKISLRPNVSLKPKSSLTFQIAKAKKHFHRILSEHFRNVLCEELFATSKKRFQKFKQLTRINLLT